MILFLGGSGSELVNVVHIKMACAMVIPNEDPKKNLNKYIFEGRVFGYVEAWVGALPPLSKEKNPPEIPV